MMLLFGALLGAALVVLAALAILFGLLVGGEFVLARLRLGRASPLFVLVLKSLMRNRLRSSLAYLAVFVLVGVVIVVWSAMFVLDRFVQEKAKDIKVVISEKWQGDSGMPFAYARPLSEGAADPARPGSIRPDDAMTWQFYVGTLDPVNKTRENLLFFIALEPCKAATLMDRIYSEVPQQSTQQTGVKLEQAQDFLAAIARLERTKQGAILGIKLLERLDKRVGDRIKVTGINYKDLDLEMEIVGTFPRGRYNDMAIMNRDYLNDALDAYPRSHGGMPHPLSRKSLNLVVVQVPDRHAYEHVTDQIDSCGLFQDPAVKCETLAAYAVTQLEGYQDIIWGMRWLLAPAILVTMALVIANGISIGVRERKKEIAVLKVIGFRPSQVLGLVLGEAMLIGALGGLAGSFVAYQAINRLVDNSEAILPVYVPEAAFWWGPSVGVLAALAGSLVPAWKACRSSVTAEFARVA